MVACEAMIKENDLDHNFKNVEENLYTRGSVAMGQRSLFKGGWSPRRSDGPRQKADGGTVQKRRSGEIGEQGRFADRTGGGRA